MSSKPEFRQEIEPVDETHRLPLSPANAVNDSTQEPKNLNDGDISSEHQISQEDLLKAIRDKLPSAEIVSGLSKQELDVLNVIADRLLYLEETKIEFIWSSVLQLVGLLFVVVFGVFAALAYNAAGVANRQSFEANQMALLSFCLSNPTSITCSGVSQDGLDSINSLATNILGPGVTIKTTTSSSSTPSSTGASSLSTSSTSASSSTTSSTNVGNSSTSLIGTPSSVASTTSSASATPSATSQPTISSTSSPISTPAGASPHGLVHFSTPAIVGTVLGVVFGLSSVLVSCWTFAVKFRDGRRYKRSSSDYI